MDYHRRPLTRTEFDDRCARLEEVLTDFGPSCTSGTRSASRNLKVGGVGESHVEGIGRDYVFDTRPPDSVIYPVAKTLGLWALYHRGHLHVQGRAPR